MATVGELRVIGEWVVKQGATIRQAAKRFNHTKSTMHKRLTTDMEKELPGLAIQVKYQLQYNQDQRHLRGGQATKERWARIRNHY